MFGYKLLYYIVSGQGIIVSPRVDMHCIVKVKCLYLFGNSADVETDRNCDG